MPVSAGRLGAVVSATVSTARALLATPNIASATVNAMAATLGPERLQSLALANIGADPS
jgi:hypothetical protein